MCFNERINSLMEKIGFNEAKTLLHDQYSCLQLITKCRDIILAPRYIGKTSQGITEQLDREVNLYSDVLQGVLISYSNIKLLQPLSLTHDDKPYFNFKIQADYIVFRPFDGCILKGVVNKTSQTHVGCLVHRHFNASIPRPRKYGDGTWKGSQLEQGDEFYFKVTSVSSNNKVLFIQGTLTDELFLIKSQSSATETVNKPSENTDIEEEINESLESSKSSKKKKKSKKRNEKDTTLITSETIQDPNESEIQENQDCVESSQRSKKKKSRRISEIDVSEDKFSFVSSDGETFHEPNKNGEEEYTKSIKKSQKKKTKLTESKEMDNSLAVDNVSSKALTVSEKRKRKKKKVKDTDTDSGIVDTDIPLTLNLIDPEESLLKHPGIKRKLSYCDSAEESSVDEPSVKQAKRNESHIDDSATTDIITHSDTDDYRKSSKKKKKHKYRHKD
ncbi:DNA-directed RNA polymerase I subunit RPA43 [Patella vulgata]|uniref:DNA-directed RNA polymerase I subunit RPA43 n=1 Tax=Patella vulgata TaxID=6465 RepID=UPI0021803958|nr:DNA-directed RNA polymerase I subunit RPA43 [Patella vulgata]